jgi:predicted RecA/RadA family phage recombinase
VATNRLYAQGNISMPLADVIGPGKSGAAVKSGDPILQGQIPGVAAIDADVLGRTVYYADGIFNLSVKGENNGGNVAVNEGDILYFDSAKAALNKDSTKVRFGYALQGVGSGATATIPVQVGY